MALPTQPPMTMYLRIRLHNCFIIINKISDLKKPGLVSTSGHLVHEAQVRGVEGEGGGARDLAGDALELLVRAAALHVHVVGQRPEGHGVYLGNLSMMSRSSGLKERAVEGRLSVTRLTHSRYSLEHHSTC